MLQAVLLFCHYIIQTMPFSENSINPDPFVQFGIWYEKRMTDTSVYPDAVSLSTSTSGGHVSSRIVLLKEFSESGFVFYTNYNSRKGQQLTENPFAAMLFYWPESGRQVRIEGRVTKVSPEESDTYFASRPRESRLGAWASEQSTVITDRDFLESRIDDFARQFHNKQVPRPSHWGGFRLVPLMFEFWQEGEFRLHDRFRYSGKRKAWQISRLSP